MFDPVIISELRAALQRQGLWGPRADRLIEEWTAHVHDDTAERVERGAEPIAADEAAWRALGTADTLARAAAREWARGSWLGRHPWLGGLVLPFFIWIASVALVVALCYGALAPSFRMHADSGTLYAALKTWQHAFNWLPWLLCMAWLAWIAARMQGGWKFFWITTATLTLFSSSFCVVLNPPLHGQGTGSIYVVAGGILGIVVSAVENLCGGHAFGPWPPPFSASPSAWIQTAVLLLGATAFRLTVGARRPKVFKGELG